MSPLLELNSSSLIWAQIQARKLRKFQQVNRAIIIIITIIQLLLLLRLLLIFGVYSDIRALSTTWNKRGLLYYTIFHSLNEFCGSLLIVLMDFRNKIKDSLENLI